MRSSPSARIRTDERPMAFTRSEFRRGAFAAWVSFIALLTLLLLIMSVDGLSPSSSFLATAFAALAYGLPIGGAVSAVVALLGAPGAWLLGTTLSTRRNLLLHAVSYFVYGGMVGWLTLVLGVTLLQGNLAYAAGFGWLVAGACAVCVSAGWAWTVRHSVVAERREAFTTQVSA